jgi:hypothetical protein
MLEAYHCFLCVWLICIGDRAVHAIASICPDTYVFCSSDGLFATFAGMRIGHVRFALHVREADWLPFTG